MDMPDDVFKTAVVNALTKNTSLPVSDLKNYSPVSGLSFMSSGEATALILIDISAAFDTINHSTLTSYLQT